MRHGLLLTAVATVTVPGLLAVLGVVGHDHVAAPASASAAPVSGPFPVAPPTARVAVRDNLAGVQRASGAPVTVLSRVALAKRATGARLLDQAASAGLATSYQGTEVATQQGVAGGVTMVSQVWHEGGGQTVVETSDGGAPEASSDPVSGSEQGVFGVTKDLVAQLGKHYVAVYTGRGTAAGKPASVVEVYRFDGSLAARYWVDGQTTVPLRRELFDTTEKVVSDDSFVRVRFGAPTLPKLSHPASPPSWSARSSWSAAVPSAGFLTALARQGWQVPTTLLSGLPLQAAASAKTKSGEVVDLEYSDGLYAVSLFVQRGTLAPDMSGWRQVSVAGRPAFVSGHSVTWAGLGYVYTMIADAPPQTVTQAVKALPRTGPPGVIDRLGRGFARLARAFDPFG